MLRRSQTAGNASERPRFRTPTLGIAPRIVGLVALTALVSGAGVGLLSVRSSRSALQNQVLADYQSQADLAAEFTQHYVQGAQRALDQLVAIPNISDAVRAGYAAQLEPVLAVFQPIEPEFDNISIYGPNGEPLARAIKASPPVNVLDREWFQAAMSTRKPYLSQPIISRGNAKPIVAYAIPVLDRDGEPVAIFVGGLSLETIANSLSARAAASPGSSLTVVDRRQDGSILAGSDRSRIAQPFDETDAIRRSVLGAERGARSHETADGDERLVALTPVEGLPWSVLIEHEKSTALAPVSRFTRDMLLLSVPMVLLACVVSGWLALQISLPIVRLRRAAQGLAAGDLKRRTGLSQRDEIGELGRAFDLMGQALEQRTEDLEQAVEELRTEVRVRRDVEAELHAARDDLELRVQERTTELGAANEALRASEEDLRLLVHGARDYALIMMDPEGLVASWNAAAERLYGYTSGEILGRHFSVFSPPEDRENGGHARVLEATRVDGSATAEGWRVRADGSRFWASIVVTALYGEDGELRGFSRLTRDITEKMEADEQLRHSEERFRSFVEVCADAIVIADADGCIRLVNAAAARMFGYEGEDVTGRRVEELLPSELRAIHRGHRAAFYAEPRPRSMGVGLALRGLRKDGSEFPAEVSLTPLQTSDGLQVAAAITDITERRRLEQAVEESVAELRRSNAELEQFAYVASHDLQEPLRMVSNYTQLLARRYEGRLDEDADAFIAFAVEGAGRMQQLINDLLEFSRVGTKGKDLRPTEMESALDTALLNLRAAIEESGAEIEHDPLPAVRGDAVQLAQLLQNLIGNAIKFRGDTPPRIRVSARRDGAGWVFAVQDNGIGIDPVYWERIFVIFQRLHTRSEYGGTGIGLALCKRIVERHRGRIWVESAPGEGATFSFTLAAVDSQQTRQPERAAAEAA